MASDEHFESMPMQQGDDAKNGMPVVDNMMEPPGERKRPRVPFCTSHPAVPMPSHAARRVLPN